jgi:predicted enzyme related to lactoylglutathione lyase
MVAAAHARVRRTGRVAAFLYTTKEMPMARPTHFEIPVDDPDRAERFYSDVFGWTFRRWEGAPQYYSLAATGDSVPGIDGAFFERSAGSGTTLTMSVDSIEESLEAITSKGGRVVQGKTPIPTMGWFATCEDTEGNRFGLFTEDANAG